MAQVGVYQAKTRLGRPGLALQGRTVPIADRVLDLLAEDEALVPCIWPLEVANALVVAKRQGRLSAAKVAQAIGLFSDLPLTVCELDLHAALTSVLELARSQGP
jgi:hypothetical protein